MASDNIIVVDLLREVVDSMRETNTVTSFTEVSGVYTIVSDNTLLKNDFISIDDVNYKVSDVSATQFNIEADTGLDFTGKTWKALAPYYEHGVPLEINNTLKEKKDDDFVYQKYPLIAVFQPFRERSDIDNSMLYSIADPEIVFVTSTERTIKAAERYSTNYNGILYPLYYSFLKAVNSHVSFNTTERSNKVFNHEHEDLLFYGSQGDNGNEANKMADPLDAIKLTSTEFRINDLRCNFLNK